MCISMHDRVETTYRISRVQHVQDEYGHCIHKTQLISNNLILQTIDLLINNQHCFNNDFWFSVPNGVSDKSGMF